MFTQITFVWSGSDFIYFYHLITLLFRLGVRGSLLECFVHLFCFITVIWLQGQPVAVRLRRGRWRGQWHAGRGGGWWLLQPGQALVATRRQPGGGRPAGDGDFHQSSPIGGSKVGGGGSHPGEETAVGAALCCHKLSWVFLS